MASYAPIGEGVIDRDEVATTGMLAEVDLGPVRVDWKGRGLLLTASPPVGRAPG